MSDLPLAEWDHALFGELFTLLGRVATQPVNPPLRRLQARLEDAKPWLLALTNVSGPNDADKNTITNEPITLANGSSVRITGELANTVNGISTALGISQLLAAVLVVQAESLHSQYPARSTPEICVFIYHQYFTELLDFLHELLRLTISPSSGIADYPFDVLREWVLDLLLTRSSLGQGKGEGMLVDQLLLQLDEHQRKIEELLRTNNPVGVEYEILTYRVGATREQQNRMAGIIGLVTEGGYLGRGQVIRVLKWLKKSDRVDGLSGVLLATFLSVTQPIPADNPPEDNPRYDWCRDIRFLKLASSLIVQDQWTNTFLRDACKLSWFAFYRSAMQFDPIAANTGIDLPTTDNFFHEPIAGEIFQHLRDWVLRIRRERGLEEDDEDIREASEDSLFKLAGRSDPRNDAFIFDQLQCLVDSLAGRKNFLKTLRNREEDALRSSKHHREEDIHAKLASRSTPAPLHYQAFMSFLAVVYRSLPEDRALHLWDDTTFTGIILDVRGNQYPGWAFWEMLTAISTGPECASISYNKMNNDTKLPWNKLFHFYQHFIDIMPKLLETVKPTRILSPAALHPDRDAIPLRGWTRLLTTVIRHSKLARDTLLTSKPNPVQVLFDFINTDVAVDPDQRRSLTDFLDLKANVYKALTAFVTRKGDVNDQEIIQRALENYERISFVNPTALFRSYEPTRVSPVGWMAKMETLEQDAHIYPLTRAYIGFLTALIPSPNASLDLPRPTSARLANTLRRGQAYVMDRVLLVPTVRRFGREREQWEIINSALGFVEKALLAYDPSELVSADLAATQFAQKAKSLADEPGFTVLIRFIGERNVFAILANILDTTSSMPLPRPDIVTSTLQRVLRVYYRIFDLQELLSVQMQILSEPRAEASDFKRPIETCSLDQYLLNHLANVNSIALLVGDQDPTVSYISTKLVCHLANSAIFSQSDIFGSEYTSSINRLAGIIDASDDSLRIAQGFCTRLQGQGEDLTAATIQDVERDVLRGEISSSSIESLPIAIRSTILDLLVEGTSTEAHGPNIAHFILGFDFRTNDLPLQDPRSAECRPSALDSILTQLMEGSEAGGASTTSLFALHPVLAARSVRLVNQLFSNPLTGRSTISHALTHFGFSSNQLSSLPLHLPADNTDSTDKRIATTSHLGDYETSATNLTAFLEYRRWVLSCVALETFTFGGYSADAADIALTVFGASTEAEADELDQDEQRLTLNDLLASVDIAWKDNTSDTTRELEYFNSFSADKFKTAQWSYYDTTTMERELRVQKRQYEQRGAVVPGNTTLAIESEIKYILDKVHAVNRETEIAWAKGEFLSAWNECLKVSLSMLFRYVPEERQEVVLFELLDSLLDRCDADSASGILENLSEAVLVSITTLINILLEFDGQNLPVDRLSLILRKILDAVTRPGTTETSRGNLFASISQYLQLLTSDFDISDDASTVMTAKDTSPMRALQRATLREFSTKKDRFIPILCRDAMDDRDVWKTECFALLGAVVSVCQSERDRAVMLPLTQMGALRLFVRDLKDREIPLQECLEPEAANLHAYWVYEAKMAFLMSVAASKKGAEDLLDAGVFEQLSMCSFVSVQPMREEIMGGSLQDSVDRQHRVLVCALQLLTRVLSSLHRSSRTGAGHAISFLNAHRESLLVILRENQQYLTLKGIEECKLIISMLAMVVHKVPSEDLRSSGGFGVYHLAVLAIAARFFDSQTWADITIPANEVSSIEGQVAGLNQVILAYLCATTQNLKSGSGLPVLLNGPSRGNGPAKHIASAPSLQLAVDMLSDLADGVQDTASGYEAAIEREADGSTRATGEEVDAVALLAKSSLLFNMIESLLLLTWRHLLFYANDALHPTDPIKPVDISLSFSTHNRLDASRSTYASARQLELVASGLRGVLERLDELNTDLNLDLRGKHGVGHGYYGMLVRRLKELCSALLNDDGNGSGNGDGQGGGMDQD